VAHHQQGLERHHHLVILDVIADQHQDLLYRHRRFLFLDHRASRGHQTGGSSRIRMSTIAPRKIRANRQKLITSSQSLAGLAGGCIAPRPLANAASPSSRTRSGGACQCKGTGRIDSKGSRTSTASGWPRRTAPDRTLADSAGGVRVTAWELAKGVNGIDGG